LASPPEDVQALLKDKTKAFSLMLPKETQAIVDLKDLFSIVSSAFKRESSKTSALSIAEISDYLTSVAADPLIQAHHS
jgi:hypothetical protein